MGDRYAVGNIRFCEKDCLCLYVCPTGTSDTENSVIDVEKCIRLRRVCRGLPRKGQQPGAEEISAPAGEGRFRRGGTAAVGVFKG